MRSRDEFVKVAKPVPVVIQGTTLHAQVKEFSTGSCGWNMNGKISIKVDDEVVQCQLSGNLVIVGSKSWHGNGPSKEPSVNVPGPITEDE